MEPSPPNFSLIVQAVAFAAEKHKTQRRKDADASPYINHPVALARILSVEAAVQDLNVLCAALLHDTVEDTETTLEELSSTFGEKIASIVAEVTDDKNLPKAIRKQLQIEHAPSLSLEAKMVKLADKIANVRDILESPPQGWDQVRKQEYFAWAAAVVAGLRGTNSKLELLFDEVIAQSEKPRSTMKPPYDHWDEEETQDRIFAERIAREPLDNESIVKRLEMRKTELEAMPNKDKYRLDELRQVTAALETRKLEL
jgi:GTP diphosphokinase / guanosine-3',5'-bis(diphosphate) 3'-diphosphatase